MVISANRLNKEGYVEVFSALLLETFYIIRNQAVKTPDPSLVRYSLQEIQALKGLSKEELRYMHFAKKEFEGDVIR